MLIEKFIYQLNLPLLTKNSRGDFHFRCVLCGDSKKSKTKKRGWILNKSGKYHYYCHNCGASMSFYNFLKINAAEVFRDYLKIYIKSKNNTNNYIEKKEEKIIFKKDTIDLPTLSELKQTHPAIKIFNKRKIPKKWLSELYFSANYMRWINENIDETKCEKYPNKDPRIVIPYRNRHKKIIAIQGRDIRQNSSLRYLTIKIRDSSKKVCGLDTIDVSKKIFVLEGFFDSVFIPNSISMGGSDLDLEYLKTISAKDNFVFLFDLEPRNIEIVAKAKKVIRAGFPICLLPTELQKYGKDINQMIMNGLTKKELYTNIKNNIYSGLSAKVQIGLWKKC